MRNFEDFNNYCNLVGIDPYSKDIVAHYFLYEVGREHERDKQQALLMKQLVTNTFWNTLIFLGIALLVFLYVTMERG